MQFHRPLIGHENIKRYFGKAFSAGRVHHAYLFQGPEQVGKATFALMLSKTLLCEGPSTSATGLRSSDELLSPKLVEGPRSASEELLPCGSCRACKAYDHGAHPDFLKLSKGENNSISVDSTREFISALYTRPLLGRHRVGIIEEAEKLGDEAANALLKTLEEPGPQVVLFLVAHAPLLPTIISRCQTIQFGFVPGPEIENGLSGLPQSAEIAGLAAGRPGRAFALRDPDTYRAYKGRAREAVQVLFRKETDRLLWVSEQFGREGNLAERRERMHGQVKIFETILRDCLLTATRMDVAMQHRFLKSEMESGLKKIGRSELLGLLKRTLQAPDLLKANVDPRLVGEYVLLNHDAYNI